MSQETVEVVRRMFTAFAEVEVDEVWSSLYTLRNGRIVRIQPFTSPRGAFEAAGLR